MPFLLLALRKSTLHLYSPSSSSVRYSKYSIEGFSSRLRLTLLDTASPVTCLASSTLVLRASTLYIGFVISSLYHKIRATASSFTGGVILQGKATLLPVIPNTLVIVSETKIEKHNHSILK